MTRPFLENYGEQINSRTKGSKIFLCCARKELSPRITTKSSESLTLHLPLTHLLLQ